MKFLIAILLLSSFSASAATLSCQAEIFKDIEGESQSVLVDNRELELDKNGNGILPGIIVWSEKYDISYNYLIDVENNGIVEVSIEDEMTHSGSGISSLKGNQKSIEFGSSNQDNGSSINLKCEIK